MTNQARSSGIALSSTFRLLAVGSVLLSALTTITLHSAQAQTFQVIHYFTGGEDGGRSNAGLTPDPAGNFYGTTTLGGEGGSGTVFKLSHEGSGWVIRTLYSFSGASDGAQPMSGLIFDRAGSLYGTTNLGGLQQCEFYPGCGTVFKLNPPPRSCLAALCPWTETVLHTFTGGSDGAFPALGNLVFDKSGNLYGTTQDGGGLGSCLSGCGTVFKLSPSGSGWTESILYRFTGGSDGGGPYAGLIFDQAGNLYGTTGGGGLASCRGGCGTVFQLSPSGSGWTESVLYSFTGGSDGFQPVGGLIFDQSSNLYGTTALGGASGGGTVFKLSPLGGGWAQQTLYSFSGISGPGASLVMDGAGDLFGTTYGGGANAGTVFELTPNPGGGWTHTALYDFQCFDGICIKGAAPTCNVVFDPQGNLYGTTYFGGVVNSIGAGNTQGVIWKITP